VSNETHKTQCTAVTCAGTGTCFSDAFPHQKALVASLSQSAIGAALAAGEDSGQDAGIILGAGDAPIEVNMLPKSGIDVSNVKLNVDSKGISGATYKILNNNSKDLIALSIYMDLYWDINPNEPVRGNYSEDGWFLHGVALKVGQEETANLNMQLTPNVPMRLLRVVVGLGYAEFSDGSTLGSDVKALQAKLTANRLIKETVYERYADMLKSGISPAALAEKIREDARFKVNQPAEEHLVLMQLESVLKYGGGSEALARKLRQAPTAGPIR
jgi:hypothetical protein